MVRAGMAGMAGLVAMLVAAPLAAQDAAPKLSDAEIAHVAVTANSVDIELGRLASTKATSAAVKSFAETMIRDHTGVNAQAAALAKKLGVTPLANAVSTSLTDGGNAAKKTLSAVSGAAFDRAYMDREIAYHEAVIGAVDKILVPQTRNAELKQLLVSVRPALVAHLEHAKSIRSGLK